MKTIHSRGCLSEKLAEYRALSRDESGQATLGRVPARVLPLLLVVAVVAVVFEDDGTVGVEAGGLVEQPQVLVTLDVVEVAQVDGLAVRGQLGEGIDCRGVAETVHDFSLYGVQNLDSEETEKLTVQ